MKKILGLAALTALLVALARRGEILGLAQDLIAEADRLGPWGPAVFITTYILACVLFFPGALLTLGAGTAFGVVRGTIYVSAGSTLGATAAFLIGRHLARERIARWVEADPRFSAISGAVAREGFKIVCLLRLSPAFPFNLLNYALGLTSVSLKDFMLASWLGMLPATVLYVYLGSLAGGLVLGGRPGGRRPEEWIFLAVGLSATLAVTLYVARLARKALRETQPTPQESSGAR